ncbi:hypothetical protein ACFFRR_011575 [Megaselia abdita]
MTDKILEAIKSLTISVASIAASISKVETTLKDEIKSSFGDVSAKLLETEERLNSNINAVEKRVIERVDAKVGQVNSRCDNLQEKIEFLQKESDKKSEKLNALEIKINNHNILLFNFKDTERDEDELIECVISPSSIWNTIPSRIPLQEYLLNTYGIYTSTMLLINLLVAT